MRSINYLAECRGIFYKKMPYVEIHAGKEKEQLPVIKATGIDFTLAKDCVVCR